MKLQRITLATLLLGMAMSGLLLATTGCAGTQYKRSTGAYVDDKSTTARVKTALIKDPAVSALDVKVNTFRGDVQLSGFVDTPEQRDRAAEIARQIPGVQIVTNNLEVKPPKPAVGAPGMTVGGTSRTVAEPVPDRLGSDLNRGTLAPDNRVLAPNNTYDRNLAPRPLSPAPLAGDLPRDFKIDSSNGKATLHGTVSTEAEKREMERRVRDLPGVQSVDNQIEVQPPAPVR